MGSKELCHKTPEPEGAVGRQRHLSCTKVHTQTHNIDQAGRLHVYCKKLFTQTFVCFELKSNTISKEMCYIYLKISMQGIRIVNVTRKNDNCQKENDTTE